MKERETKDIILEVLIPCLSFLLLPFMIAAIFYGCQVKNSKWEERSMKGSKSMRSASLPEEARPGDTLILYEDIMGNHIQMDFYKGEPLKSGESLIILK